jgi:hypothetical protein
MRNERDRPRSYGWPVVYEWTVVDDRMKVGIRWCRGSAATAKQMNSKNVPALE